MHYGYLVVEGPHDADFVGKFLRVHGLGFVDKMTTLDSFWYPLIPTSFPHNDDFGKAVPVPLFYQSATHSVAVSKAGSDYESVVKTLEETQCSFAGYTKIQSVGLVCDADSADPTSLFVSISSLLSNKNISPPKELGVVSSGNPRMGVFILPDNETQGTVEDILLQAGSLQYPALCSWAKASIACVAIEDLKGKEIRDFNRPAGKMKATVALMSSILKPGKAVQNTIRDNRWICSESIKEPFLQPFDAFLLDLLGL